MSVVPRLRFAGRYAAAHLLISLLVAVVSAAFVFGLLYPPPWQAMLGVTSIFLLILVVDVVCGPLLTLILASPAKSRRERWLDFSLIGLLQVLALAYGIHSVWIARPVVLAFERDRLVLVTANEIDPSTLHEAPEGMRHLPWWGVRAVATRRPKDNDEFFQSVGMGTAGLSPGMRPGWWLPWEQARQEMSERARPLSSLMAARPEKSEMLEAAARKTGQDVARLRYLPLTTARTPDWIALLDADLQMVGWAQVDGFIQPDQHLQP